MGTQILAGSSGMYKKFNEASFTVTHDTCMDSEKLPVKFKDASEGCWIPMRDATFDLTKLKTKDFKK